MSYLTGENSHNTYFTYIPNLVDELRMIFMEEFFSGIYIEKFPSHTQCVSHIGTTTLSYSMYERRNYLRRQSFAHMQCSSHSCRVALLCLIYSEVYRLTISMCFVSCSCFRFFCQLHAFKTSKNFEYARNNTLANLYGRLLEEPVSDKTSMTSPWEPIEDFGNVVLVKMVQCDVARLTI